MLCFNFILTDIYVLIPWIILIVIVNTGKPLTIVQYTKRKTPILFTILTMYVTDMVIQLYLILFENDNNSNYSTEIEDLFNE